MWQRSEHEGGEELFLAGERVRPGIYRQIGGFRQICLDHEDILPASLDGRVACYRLVRNQWGQMAKRSEMRA